MGREIWPFLAATAIASTHAALPGDRSASITWRLGSEMELRRLFSQCDLCLIQGGLDCYALSPDNCTKGFRNFADNRTQARSQRQLSDFTCTRFGGEQTPGKTQPSISERPALQMIPSSLTSVTNLHSFSLRLKEAKIGCIMYFGDSVDAQLLAFLNLRTKTAQLPPLPVKIEFRRSNKLPFFDHAACAGQMPETKTLFVAHIGLHEKTKAAYPGHLKALLGHLEKKTRDGHIALYRETSAQHFGTETGEFEGLKREDVAGSPSPPFVCRPLLETQGRRPWRNEILHKIIDGKYPTVGVLPFEELTKPLWTLHPEYPQVGIGNAGNLDCTHFCYSPALVEGFVGMLDDAIAQQLTQLPHNLPYAADRSLPTRNYTRGEIATW